jgi:hypothetical protein
MYNDFFNCDDIRTIFKLFGILSLSQMFCCITFLIDCFCVLLICLIIIGYKSLGPYVACSFNFSSAYIKSLSL